MSERFRMAMTAAWQRIEEQQWVFGYVGKLNADGSHTYAVPGRANFIYITLRKAGGAQTVVPARNDAMVALEAGIPVRMKVEQGVYVIYGRSGRTDLGSPAIPVVNPHTHDDRYYTETQLNTSGAGGAVHWDNITNEPATFPPSAHDHDDRYFTEAEHIDTSAGAADAGKPIKLDSSGLIDDSMLPPITATLPNATAVVYVARDGNDANDGLDIASPKLTIGSAITAAATLIGAGAPKVRIEVLDAGTYTEASWTLAPNTILHAPAATLVGLLSIDDGCSVLLDRHYPPAPSVSRTRAAPASSSFGLGRCLYLQVVLVYVTVQLLASGMCTSS
jgi:hypothetical protein